jgi:uncharacterized protein (DUF2062 family)
MPENLKINNLSKILKLVYLEIFKIDDTPQKIALGLGIGIFAGVIPGTGPLAAIFLAYIFRANRAAALFGSLLINTWSSIIVFFFAIHVGAKVFNISWQTTKAEWDYFIDSLHWLGLFKVSVFKAMLPTLIGYLIIALILGIITYLLALLALRMRAKNQKIQNKKI